MIFWEIAKKDISVILKSKIKLMVILVVILMPLAYGFLYLWASWDPYANMKNVAVAVVNNDSGSDYEGKKENYGQQIVDELYKNKVVDWQLVDQQSAASGLDNQKYYAIVEIPSSFSSDIISASGNNPIPAVIEWQTKDSTNYLFTKYFDAVMKELNKEINKKVADNVKGKIQSRVTELSLSLDQASNGAASLRGGLATLYQGADKIALNLKSAENGANDLNSGLNQLNDKTFILSSGISQARGGVLALSAGLSSAKSGASNLNSGLASLYTGSQQLKNGTATAYNGSVQLSSGANEMATKINTINDLLSPFYDIAEGVSSYISSSNDKKYSVINIPGYLSVIKDKKNQFVNGQNSIAGGAKDLSQGLAALDSGASSLNSGLYSASQGAQTLNSGINDLYNGSGNLENGLANLYDGSQKFGQGVSQAYNGSSFLYRGLGQLSSGELELSSGIKQAEQGASLLSDKLSAGSENLKKELNQDKLNKLVDFVNYPVIIKNVSVDDSGTYGSALSPYFISLALWMGALMLTLLIPTKDQQLAANNVSRFSIIAGKTITSLVISFLQAGCLVVAILAGLGLEVKYFVPFILFCMLTSFCFISIMQLIALIFGKVGELIGILLMLMQLTSSSGTFPIQSTPRIFRIFNPFSPMNYSIKGMRLLILGGSKIMMWQQSLALALMTIISIGLRAIATKNTFLSTDIYPLIEL